MRPFDQSGHALRACEGLEPLAPKAQPGRRQAADRSGQFAQSWSAHPLIREASRSSLAGSIEGKELYWIAISVILCHMTAHPQPFERIVHRLRDLLQRCHIQLCPIEADEDSDTSSPASCRSSPMSRAGASTCRASALCGTVCSTYAVRPRICRDYKCRVLTRLEQGELGFDEAAGLVSEARAAVDRVTACLRPDENLCHGAHALAVHGRQLAREPAVPLADDRAKPASGP